MNEDFGGDIITISDEDGNEFDLELLDTIEFEGQTYCVFVPADIENMDVNDPDYGLIFLKSREENGEELFDSVDDDDELDVRILPADYGSGRREGIRFSFCGARSHTSPGHFKPTLDIRDAYLRP